MDYIRAIDNQRIFFNSGKTLPLKFRRDNLINLRQAIKQNEQRIFEALNMDLSKCKFEAYMTEIGIVLEEISYQLKNLKRFMKIKKVKTPLMHFPSKSFVMSSPLGVVLIMSPWNYPFQLTMAPIVGAIAAGNCVVVKPSRYSEHTSKVIEEILSQIYPKEYVITFQGGSDVNTKLLECKFDHIFFTGSTTVGKVVMKKAAEFVCPVSLELGGKSPCIVDSTANIQLAARRIMWGKCLNSGQTCVAPDYVIVHESIKDELLLELKKAVVWLYGENQLDSDKYCKIINTHHYDRLKDLLGDGDIYYGGGYCDKTLKLQLTIIENIHSGSQLISDEIFGPILPIFTYNNIQQLVADLKCKPKPLALYLFTQDRKQEAYVLSQAQFGGATVNDTIIHLTNSNMAFGGVGESGMGGYHGRKSFETFSHQKSVMRKSNKLDIKIRYAPNYNDDCKLIKKFMK